MNSIYVLVIVFAVIIGVLLSQYHASRSLYTTLRGYRSIVNDTYPHLPYTDEVSERLAVLEHISPDDVVLEIGANMGGVSSLLATVIDPKNLVSVEPHGANCDHLKQIGAQLGREFHVFRGVVKGPVNLLCTGEKTVGSYCTCVESSDTTTENLTISEIENKFQKKFTAIVIDCEGCYEGIMDQILASETIKQIQIEWDGKFIENRILASGYTLQAVYKHVSIKSGVRVYKRT